MIIGLKQLARGLDQEHALAYTGRRAPSSLRTMLSRARRAEIGHHHHISGAYLLRYAQEASWREDNRRMSNGEQVNRLAGLAMKRAASVDFTGYWQRHISSTV